MPSGRSTPPSGSDDNRTIALDDGGTAADVLVAGRYRLDGIIGRGGGGAVWRARDRVNDQVVAVKLLSPETSNQLVRAGREVTALRLLQLPGVVRLLDSGTDGGRQFLVMELVDGAPFPGVGVGRDWTAIAPRVRGLIDALRLVHALGIVHRDLKPANVLVDVSGRITLLDFGIARGEALGPTVTMAQAVLGTPQYLAPEQLRGEAIDARADLYALGVMLFEALSGSLPFAQFAARLHQDAPPLLARAPGVPAYVADLVDRLLSRVPDQRPRSADEVLALLDADAQIDRNTLPLLGSGAVVDALVDAALEGRSVDVWGPSGSGKSRVLREAAARIRAKGRTVVETTPGERPLESVASLVARPTDTQGKPLAVAEDQLRDALVAGTVIIADHPERLDRWSRSLLDRTRARGAVLRAADTPGALRLDLVSQDVLLDLFMGPDVILHLREDGARILHARTNGLPSAMVREINTWIAAGVAAWADGRVRVDRLGLDRLDAGLFLSAPVAQPGAPTLETPLDDLLAWVALAGPSAHPDFLHEATGIPTWEIEAELLELRDRGVIRTRPDGQIEAIAPSGALQRWSDEERLRAHRALASKIPPGSPGRIEHLAAAGDVPAVADEALHLAARLLPAGALGRAIGMLSVALGAVREDPRAPREVELVTELARAALAEGSGPALRAARFEVARTPRALDLARLLEAWELAQARQGDRAEAIAVDLPPFADPEIDSYRLLIPIRAATARDPAEAERRIHALDGRPDPTGLLRTRKLLALGHVRYRQGRHRDAAGLYRQVAAAEHAFDRRASALVNAGNALRDAGELEAALEAFTEARSIAARHRMAVLEASAVAGERSVLYRLDRLTAPDGELIEAVAALDEPSALGQAALTEAAVAWRAGDSASGIRLAGIAAAAWDRPLTHEAAVLARTLALACGEPGLDLRGLRDAVAAMRDGPARTQANALLALGSSGIRAPLRVGDPRGRMGVLTPEECRQAQLSAPGGGSP